MLLTNLQLIRPVFESTQEETLRWLVHAHVMAEKSEAFRSTIEEKLWHVGCKPDHIQKRGHVLADFLHTDWEKMTIYTLNETPQGKNLSARSEVFEEEVDKVFDQFYPTGSSAPNDLIHVSCTGYLSPNGAQKIVSKRGLGEETTVTNAYHMGCYGSMPAIRMGIGFLKNREEVSKVDVVHTEICSLHSNPSMHKLDQLVSQSLFADGFIKYSLVQDTDAPHFKLLALKEEIIPDSLNAMSWNVADWGFQMFLAKEVPVLIRRYLPSYLKRLAKRLEDKPLFAVHPGGPKILTHIQELLELSDSQMAYSFQVLKEYGNMSSATLPHIWEKILADTNIPSGTQVVSLAFGPGLSISGSLMEKICGS